MILRVILLTIVLSLPQLALARSNGLEREAATTFAEVDYGFTTHKSEFVNSNDTGTSLRYAFGFTAGQERTVGVIFRTDTSTMSFELNSSSTTLANQDIILRYRMGNFFLGATVNSSTLAATRAEATENGEIELTSSGYGGYFGTIFDVGRNSAWYLNGVYGSYGQNQEVAQIDVSMTTRMDIDTGVSFFLSKELVSLNFGYRQRTVGLSDAAGSYTDTITSTYLGLRFNLIF